MQAASNQLITESSTEVSWAIHSRLIGEDASLVSWLFLTSSRHSNRPVIPSGLQQSILAQLTALFDGVAGHYQLIRDARRKKTRTAASSSQNPTEDHACEPNRDSPRPSMSTLPIISHITVGINEVTKALEKEIRSRHQTVIIPGKAVDETQFLARFVFICYADLDTPAFVAHLPQLIALCNSARPEQHRIKVIQLPAGAQISLANALGYLKRVSVIALDVCSFRLLS